MSPRIHQLLRVDVLQYFIAGVGQASSLYVLSLLLEIQKQTGRKPVLPEHCIEVAENYL
jgi:hypothetical protein